ncbi:MAG: hypothetical protein WD267_06770 [Balneolales bacterium]
MSLLTTISLAQEETLSDWILAARSAGIEQTRLDEIQSRAIDRGISDQQLMQIIEPAVALAEQNLPTDMIFQKAMEGMAKGIPFQQMNPVLQNLRQNTESVVSIVDPWIGRAEVSQMMQRSGEQVNGKVFRNELLKAGSKALSQNVTTESLKHLLDAIGEEATLNRAKPSGILTAVSIFSDLPSTAEHPEASGSVIARALQSGFEADDLQKLPGAMHSAQRRSQLPSASVIEGITGQMQGGSPASQILQNLFNGNPGGGPPGGMAPGLKNRPDRGRPN